MSKEKFDDNYESIQNRITVLKKTWQEFIATGKVESDNIVSAEVLSSWTRSRNRGIDPYNVPNKKLSQEELEKRLKKNSQLLKVATPFLQEVAADVEGTGFRVDLFDEDIFLLWNYGDTKVLRDSRERSSIQAGVSRSEATCGTNAINLAALLERPVQLLGPEHYNAALQHWACSAVPIKDENGKVIAVINAAGYYWLIHKHTLGMMTALGKSIEYCLMQQSAQKKMEETNKFYKEIMGSITDALIVVSADGRIMMTNLVAKKSFGMSNFEMEGLAVDFIWGRNNPFSEVLKTGQPILDREVSFVRQNKITRLMATIRPIDIEGDRLKGVVGIFRGRNHTRGIIKNFVGWKAHFFFDNLIGDSGVFRQVVRLAKETAKMDSNVLIEGESGTGKELFAQAIHNDSKNSEGPFVVVNCAAIPSGLLESELFGYEGGAFTGAKKEGQPGKFELAESGSIFLDEINSLPMEMQAKILRTLQNKTVVRLGGADEIPVRVRVISASNADLWQMVQRGEFREDLFYRINVITINLPPLRERGSDLELLVQHILSIKKIPADVFDDEAVHALKSYEWPGNVRELENVLERSFVFSKSRGVAKVEAEDVLNYPGIGRTSYKNEVPAAVASGMKEELNEGAFGLKGNEKNIILKALQATQGNVSTAAQILGVARNTLYRKMKRFDITVDEIGRKK